MNVRLTTLTDAELSAIDVTMSNASGIFRLLGRFREAAAARSVGAECTQILITRAEDHRSSLARQLSLVPRGAYDEQ